MAKKTKKYIEGKPTHEKPEGKKLEKAEKKMGEKKAEAAFMKKGKKKRG